MLSLSSHTNIFFILFTEKAPQCCLLCFVILSSFLTVTLAARTGFSLLSPLIDTLLSTTTRNIKKSVGWELGEMEGLQFSVASKHQLRLVWLVDPHLLYVVSGPLLRCVTRFGGATGEVKNTFMTHCSSCNLTGKGTKKMKE